MSERDVPFAGASAMSPAINPVYLTGSLTGWPLEELAAAGYRGLEVTPACLEVDAAWRTSAEKSRLGILCVNALHNLRPYLTGSLADAVAWRRRATLDTLLRTLGRMRELHIPYLVVAPSRLAEVYQTQPEARALLIASLRELAAAGDATILVQAGPARLYRTSKEIAALVDEAGRPNIGAALDVGHALLAHENPAEAANALGSRLRYVTVHDADLRPGAPKLDRHLPLGSGSAKPEEVRSAVGHLPWSVGISALDDPIKTARSAMKWMRG
jgi:sugar phosphate isomerase/epimerase